MHYNKVVQKQRDFFNTDATHDLELRKEQLRKLRAALVKNCDRLADALYLDLRRERSINRSMEVDMLLADIDHYLEKLDEYAAPVEVPATPIGTAYLHKMPKGVVLIIAPFNFPVHLAFRPLIAVLAAGCTAIIKPSEHTEHCAQAIYDLVKSTFDDCYVNVVLGDGQTCSALLEQRFDHIFYTGGTRIGKLIMGAAAQHLTPVTLELGGKCPCYIDETADIAEAAAKTLTPKFLNNGQICISVDHVLVHEKVKDQFVKAFIDAFKNVFTTHPKSSPLYSRIVNTNHWNRLKAILRQSQGKVVFQADDPDDHDDLFLAPRVVEVYADDALMDDEIFGPILPVLGVKGVDDAIRIVRESGERPLASYVFTKDEKVAQRYIEKIYAGSTVVNDVMAQYFNPHLPFGGIGNSGMGRTHGKYGFDNFTHEKPVVTSTSAKGALGG